MTNLAGSFVKNLLTVQIDPQHRHLALCRRPHAVISAILVQTLLWMMANACAAEDAKTDIDQLRLRLQAAEQRIRNLESQNVPRTSDLEPELSDKPGEVHAVEQAGFYEAYEAGYNWNNSYTSSPPLFENSDFFADYDGGFVIRPFDDRAAPFELQINSRLQFRHVGFARDRKFYSNRGDTFRGGPVRVNNRNDFEIERGRLVFRGFVYTPELRYFLNFDFDTDDNHRVIAHDFWFNYKFSDAFDLHFGKARVPGSRDWLESSAVLRFADRSMATTFFRPDRSVGVWAAGELAEDVFYRAMVSNGYTATDLAFADLDTNLAYSLSKWWDVYGNYGVGYSDLKWHDEPAAKVGHSFTYANQSGVNSSGIPRSEQNFIRLSDGTQLITPDALAPGVTVIGSNIFMYAIDFAGKYQGWSFNSELFFRWLTQFKTVGGPVPHSQLYTHGFYADVGYMLIKERLEIIGRISNVDGLFKDSWEYAGGVNWFVNGTHRNKVTFDITHLDGAPVENTGPNYQVGQDGILTRLQWQIAF